MERISRSNGSMPANPTYIVYDDQDRISKIVFSQVQVIEEREYNAQGQLYKNHQYRDSDDPTHKTDEHIFEYDGQGKLIKINGSHSDAFNNSFQTLNKLTYNAEGLIAIDSGFFFSSGTKPWFTRKIEYTYDNKKGINEYEIGEPKMERYLYLFAPLKHNITSFKRTENNSSPVETTFQYLYNEQDLPVKISAFANGSQIYSTRITYKLF